MNENIASAIEKRIKRYHKDFSLPLMAEQWEETKGGWKGTGDFKATINRSMSDQLWTTLPLDKVDHVYEIDGNPS